MARLTQLLSIAPAAGGSWNGTGVISTAGASSTTEWGSFAARYSEARVVAIKAHFVPTYPVGYVAASSGSTAYVSGRLAIGTDRSGAYTAPTSIQSALSLQNSRLVATHEPFVYEVRATDLEDQLFTSTTAAVPAYYRMLFGTDNTIAGSANTVYNIFVEYMVQFRGAT